MTFPCCIVFGCRPLHSSPCTELVLEFTTFLLQAARYYFKDMLGQSGWAGYTDVGSSLVRAAPASCCSFAF